MTQKLNLGDQNSRWTPAQEGRLVDIVDKELGHDHLHLNDGEIEAVLDEIGKRYDVGRGGERTRGALRARLRKLRVGILLHVFLEYERLRRDGHRYTWKGTRTPSQDTYRPVEVQELDDRREMGGPSLKVFIRHEEDKQKGVEDLVAGGFIGLDWIIVGETAYYVTPKIQETDYARMFVDVFTLDRSDSFEEYRKLFTERTGMYQIDHSRRPIPLPKKKEYLSICIFTELLLVHLIDMTWIMSLASRFLSVSGPWDRLRDMIRRARKGSLVSREAEKVILGFLEQKEADSSRASECLAPDGMTNTDDVYGGISEDEWKPLIEVLDGILSSAEDPLSQDLVIPPFRINMPKLFELYVYYLLSRMDRGRIKHLIRYQVQCELAAFDGLSKPGYPKPDFLIEGKGMLIDAKYKVDYNEESHYSASDMRQLLSYTRLHSVADICKAKGEITTVIAYSATGNVGGTVSLEDLADDSRPQVEKNRDAIELYKCALPLPRIS